MHAACLKSAADGPRAGRYTDFSGARRRLQQDLRYFCRTPAKGKSGAGKGEIEEQHIGRPPEGRPLHGLQRRKAPVTKITEITEKGPRFVLKHRFLHDFQFARSEK